MSVAPQENQAQTPENKPSDKEVNFRKQEEMYKRQVEQERTARLQVEERASQLEKLIQQKQAQPPLDDDDDGDEPYVDHKKLAKKFHKFEERMEAKIDEKAEAKARKMMEEERKNNWLRTNTDFYEVMQHAQAFADKDPELAETILAMPEGFERQKLVYKNIKALGMHKKEEAKPSVQDKIDQNKRSPYYQPSGVGSAPYAAASDFSPAGQKNAYQKLQQLKARLGV